MNMIRSGPAPSDRAASMYSFSLRDRVWPRTIRASAAQEKNAMTTMITIGRLGPNTDDQREGQRPGNGNASTSVHDPGQHRVDDAAEVAGDQADGDAEHGRDERWRTRRRTARSAPRR